MLTPYIKDPRKIQVYGTTVILPEAENREMEIFLAAAVESFIVSQECRCFRSFVLAMEDFDAALIWHPSREPYEPDTYELWIEENGKLHDAISSAYLDR
jgi:hypothetical protein